MASAAGLTLSLEPAALPDDAVEVARIGEAWGVKGWFKVIPHSASPEALFSSKRWYLLPPERGAVHFNGSARLRIRQAKAHGDGVVAHADGIDDRALAERLKGARILIARSSFPTPAADEYYWVDLIGLRVRNREGVELGRVKDLMSTGPQTVLVVVAEDASSAPASPAGSGTVQEATPDPSDAAFGASSRLPSPVASDRVAPLAPAAAPKPREILIPFVGVFIDAVDVPGGLITVDWQPDD